MRNKIIFLLLIISLSLVIMTGRPSASLGTNGLFLQLAFAQEEMVSAQFAKEGGKFIGKVFLNNVFVCKFYSEEEGNLKLKINNIAARFEKLISDAVDEERIKCVAGPKEAVVKTDTDILFTISGAELGADEYSYFNAGKQYCENLKVALQSLPKIKFSETIVVIPKGKLARVKIFGDLTGDYKLEGYDSSIVNINNATKEYIEIAGVETGETRIDFIYPPLKKRLVVIVKEAAGYIPDGLAVVVTGNPAPVNLIKEAVLENLTQKIESKHKVSININQTALNKIGPLYPYKSKSLGIPVSLSGKGFIKVSKKVYVKIENNPIALNNTTYLFASNRPETIVNNGKLFNGKIQDFGAHRLMFHHKCYEQSNKRKFEIRLVNNSGQSSFVYIIKGYDVDDNELYAGFYGGKDFFKALLSRKGYVQEVKPNSYANVLVKYLNPGDIIGGLVNFQVIKGTLPEVIVQSSTYRHSNYYRRELSEGKLVHPRGTFAGPDLKFNYEHYLGEEYTFIDIGAAPFLKEIDGGEPCYGNYGAFYNVDISLINDKDYDKECEILLQARAGPARAVLLLDGKLMVLSKTIYFPNEVLLGKYKIKAGQTRKVNIITFPMGGINYPVVILAKS